PWVWVIGRTQTNGTADYEAVHAVQDGYGVTPVSPQEFTADPSVDTDTEPLRQVNGLSAVEFFSEACDAMVVNPPHSTDFSILARIAGIGIVPGRPFDSSELDAETIAEIEAGAGEARAMILAAPAKLAAPVNGWIVLSDT